MNNENINPNYKGRFLKHIVADYYMDYLEFDEGTVLIQDTGGLKVFFQLKGQYSYYNEWSETLSSRNLPMEVLLGSVIVNGGWPMPATQKFCFAQHVRVPTDDELEWYEKQNVV